jgi:phosphatidylserine/phosphatidylglycerophosphate/cardiolipin synthase-like enzyme
MIVKIQSIIGGTPREKPSSLLICPDGGYSARKISKLICKAQKTLDIYMMYFDKSCPIKIFNAIRLCVKRDVRVRIICSNIQKNCYLENI